MENPSKSKLIGNFPSKSIIAPTESNLNNVNIMLKTNIFKNKNNNNPNEKGKSGKNEFTNYSNDTRISYIPSARFESFCSKTSTAYSSTFHNDYNNNPRISTISNIKNSNIFLDIEEAHLNESIDLIDDEVENKNFIYKANSKEIQYISIDLLFKKVVLNDLNLFSDNYNILDAFINQYTIFLTTEDLIDKLVNVFLYTIKKNLDLVNFVNFLNNFTIVKYVDTILQNDYARKTFINLYEHLKLIDSKNKILSKYDIEHVYEIFEQDTIYDIQYLINRLVIKKKKACVKLKISKVPMPKSNIFDVNEWSPLIIAKQLSDYSHKLFSKIEYNELLLTNWTKKDKNKLSPNVVKIIERFDKVSFWVVEEILSYDKKSQRARAIENFLNISLECKNLKNFNDCRNILSGVNHFIIQNLHKTWKRVNEKSLEIFKSLNDFCSYVKNYKKMREEMKLSLGEPCVPYLGLLLMKLAFIEEGPKYTNKENLINIEKIMKVNKEISFFFEFKTQTYNFNPLECLNILYTPKPISEKELEIIADKLGI